MRPLKNVGACPVSGPLGCPRTDSVLLKRGFGLVKFIAETYVVAIFKSGRRSKTFPSVQIVSAETYGVKIGLRRQIILQTHIKVKLSLRTGQTIMGVKESHVFLALEEKFEIGQK